MLSKPSYWLFPLVILAALLGLFTRPVRADEVLPRPLKHCRFENQMDLTAAPMRWTKPDQVTVQFVRAALRKYVLRYQQVPQNDEIGRTINQSRIANSSTGHRLRIWGSPDIFDLAAKKRTVARAGDIAYDTCIDGEVGFIFYYNAEGFPSLIEEASLPGNHGRLEQ